MLLPKNDRQVPDGRSAPTAWRARIRQVAVLGAVASVALCAACTPRPGPVAGAGSSAPARSAATTAPAASWLPSGATLHQNIAYGSDPDQRLDVYQPEGAHADAVIVMVHGGGWTRGDKAADGVVQNKVKHYLPAGYLFVSVDYRLGPQVKPPAQAQDVASAVAFVQQHAAQWGGDGSKLVVMGHSAGANLVSLVAADPAYAQQAGTAPWLGTVALDSAAYNVPQIMAGPHLSLYDPVFGHDAALQRQSSPTLVLAGRPAPMLLVCGSGRKDSCPQANAFAVADRAEGGTATVFPTPLRHAEIDSQLGAPGALTREVDTFLHSLGLPG